MKKYFVTITETLEKTVEVFASNEEEAKNKVEDRYKSCDIILDYEDLENTDFSIYKVESTESEEN